MTREWLPNGITSPVPFRLSSDSKEHLRNSLVAHGIELGEKEDDFMKSMERAAEGYVAMKKIADKSKPGSARGNLRFAIQRADELLDSINELDGNSRMLISEAQTNGVERLYESLENIMLMLYEACERAAEYPKRGALVAYHKYALVQGILNALVKHFDVHPTTTRDSLLEACVEIMYSAVSDKPVTSVHSLVERSLKWMST